MHLVLRNRIGNFGLPFVILTIALLSACGGGGGAVEAVVRRRRLRLRFPGMSRRLRHLPPRGPYPAQP